jgi:predicted thioredoxin/glutaredoxin
VYGVCLGTWLIARGIFARTPLPQAPLPVVPVEQVDQFWEDYLIQYDSVIGA